MVSLKYVLEPSNVITAFIILLQGIGSGWTKHYQNLAMYLSFWLLTLASAIVNHLTQSAADSEVNDQRFWAAVLGSDVAYDPAASSSCAAADPAAAAASGLRGFSRVSAAQLGMGNIVAVLPGQRVPIEGYVLPAPLVRSIAAAGGVARVVDATGGAADATARAKAATSEVDEVEAAPFSYAVTGENTVAYPAFRSLPLHFSAIHRVECRLLEDGEAAAQDIPVLTARDGASAAASAAAAALPSATNKTVAATAVLLARPASNAAIAHAAAEAARPVDGSDASAASAAASAAPAIAGLASSRLGTSASLGHSHPYALTGRGAFTTAPAYDRGSRNSSTSELSARDAFALPFVRRERTRSAETDAPASAAFSGAAIAPGSIAAAKRIAGQKSRNSPRSRSFDRPAQAVDARRLHAPASTSIDPGLAADLSLLPPVGSPPFARSVSDQSSTASSARNPRAAAMSTEPRPRRLRRTSGSPLAERRGDSDSDVTHSASGGGRGTSRGGGLARMATRALFWGKGQLLDKLTLEPPRARAASPRLPADPDARALRLGGSDAAFAEAVAEAVADAHDADVAEALETGGAAAEVLLRASAAAAAARTLSESQTGGATDEDGGNFGRTFVAAPLPLSGEMLRRSLAEDASATAGGILRIDAEAMLQEGAHETPVPPGAADSTSVPAPDAAGSLSASRMTSLGTDGGIGAPLALSDFVLVGNDGRGSAASAASGKSSSGSGAGSSAAPAAVPEERHRQDEDGISGATHARSGRISATSADSDAGGGIIISRHPGTDSPPALPSLSPRQAGLAHAPATAAFASVPPSSERLKAEAAVAPSAPTASVVAPVASPNVASALSQPEQAALATAADQPTAPVAAPATAASQLASSKPSAAPAAQPVFIYLVNGARVPARCDRVPRGVVHAPEAAASASASSAEGHGTGTASGQLSPLFLLAALPRRFESEESGAHAAAESSWSYTIRRVFYIQIAVLVVFSLQGTLAGAEMTREAQVAAGGAVAATYTLAAFFGFLLGHAVMANTLLPLRESLVNAILLGICKALLPGVRVRNDLILETVRSVRNVVSDKTGTITIDSMAFRWPIRCPAWSDGFGLGPALLFCTNDSKPNPLFKRQLQGAPCGTTVNSQARNAGDGVDPRLGSTPALCTTSEEGAIFHSLTTPLSERDFPGARAADLARFPDEDRHFKLLYAAEPAGTSPGLLLLHDVAGSGLLRVILHHRGGFIPSLVARLSVASFASRPVADGLLPPLDAATLDPTSAGAALADAGWSAASPPLLVVQGGGDAVARCCGPAAAAFERSELEADPNRTFGHAVALFAFPHLCFEQEQGTSSAAGKAGAAAIGTGESILLAKSQLRMRASSGTDSARHHDEPLRASSFSSHATVSAVAAAMMDIRSLGRSVRVAGEAVVKAHAASARAAAAAASRSTAPTPASPAASRHGSAMRVTSSESNALASSSGGGFFAPAAVSAAMGSSFNGFGAVAGAGSGAGLAFSLTHLSKFVNPICPGAEWLFDDLASQGVRLHLCSGDTLLTLRSVAQDMRILKRDGDDHVVAARGASASIHSQLGPAMTTSAGTGAGAGAGASSGTAEPANASSASAVALRRTPSAGPPAARSVELTWDESVVPAMQAALRGLRAEMEAAEALEAAELAAEEALQTARSSASGGSTASGSADVTSPFSSPLASLTALLGSGEDSEAEVAAEGGDGLGAEDEADREDERELAGDLLLSTSARASPLRVVSSSTRVAALSKGSSASSSLPGGQSLEELAAHLESCALELRRLAASGASATRTDAGEDGTRSDPALRVGVPALALSSSRIGPPVGAAGTAHVGSEGGGAASGLESPFAVALRTLDAHPRSRLCIFVCADVLLLLHAHVDLPAVASLLGHSRVVFFFYRIKASLKPLAIDLMSAVEVGDAAASGPYGSSSSAGGSGIGSTNAVTAVGAGSGSATAGGGHGEAATSSSRCIFMGDGPNDAPALSRTPHSVAMRVGSVLARNVANAEAESSVALPELITLARLFHGGRAVVLRDVVFVGTCTVLLLSVAAHISGFETVGGSASSSASTSSGRTGTGSGSRVKMFADAWSPFLMLVYTMLVHTPRMLVQALAEGLRPEWHDHRSLLVKVGGEVLLALCCSLWTGMRLKHSIADVSNYPVPTARSGAGSSAAYVATGIQMYAPLALASLALLTYLRQNLIISSRLRGGSTLRLLPPRATGVVAAQLTHDKTGAGAGASMAASPNGRAAHAGWKLTFVSVLNGLPGQLLVFVLYLALVSHRRLPVWTCFTLVLKSVAAPAVLMGVYRLLTALNANTGKSIEAGVRRFATRGSSRA